MKRILLAILTAGSMVSAQATIYEYILNFAPEGSVVSAGTGSGTVSYDDVAHMLQLQATFSGLTVPGSTGVTASHIHAPTLVPFTGNAGVATTTPSLVGFPTGVYSGSYSNTLDLTLSGSWNSAFITANGGTTATAESALAGAMASGRSYWNIHTSLNGGGEIRGYLTAVPEPSSVALVGLSIIGVAARVWSKRRAIKS